MSLARWLARAALLVASFVPAACARPTPAGGPLSEPGGPAASASGAPVASAPGAQLTIVAVSPVVAEIVSHVAPDASVQSLAPLGDPAGYEPTPDDVASAAAADLVIGTTQELQALGRPGSTLAGSGEQGPITFFLGAGSDSAYPWLDPRAVAGWVTSLAQSLETLDPAGSAAYRDAAERYARELAVASGMLMETAQAIPEERRVLLTDAPDAAAGLAAALGIDAVPRPLVAGVTSVEGADALGVDEVAGAIREAGDSFVFLIAPGNQSRAAEIADAAGRPVGLLFLVSLTGPEGPAPDYLSMMRFNAESLMEGLGSQDPPTP